MTDTTDKITSYQIDGTPVRAVNLTGAVRQWLLATQCTDVNRTVRVTCATDQVRYICIYTFINAEGITLPYSALAPDPRVKPYRIEGISVDAFDADAAILKYISTRTIKDYRSGLTVVCSPIYTTNVDLLEWLDVHGVKFSVDERGLSITPGQESEPREKIWVIGGVRTRESGMDLAILEYLKSQWWTQDLPERATAREYEVSSCGDLIVLSRPKDIDLTAWVAKHLTAIQDTEVKLSRKTRVRQGAQLKV